MEILSNSDEPMEISKITKMADLTMEDDEAPKPTVHKENAACTPELLATNENANTLKTSSAPQVPEKTAPQRLYKYAQEPQQLDQGMLEPSIEDGEANKALKSINRTKNISKFYPKQNLDTNYDYFPNKRTNRIIGDEVQKTESMAKVKNTVSMIRKEVEYHHESRIVDGVKNSLAKCSQNYVAYSHATSVFNPARSY